MGQNRFGYLVFRLKLGDDEAWNYIKNIHSEMLNIVIVSDLLDNDLPFSLHPLVFEKTWERANDLIGEFEYRDGQSERNIFDWLLYIERKFQEQLIKTYHDMDSPKFIALLKQPDNEALRDDFNWAWKRIIKLHKRTLVATIHAVLASRMAFDSNDVEDIWQRAYLNIQRRVVDFSPQFKGALVRWMHSHVRNEALNFYRVHITKKHTALETVEYQTGVDFEDPLDSDKFYKKQMREAYYDAIVDIMLDLQKNPASQTLTIDQQRRAIKRLFDGKFEKPNVVANALSVEAHIIHNLVRVIKRRLEKYDTLAVYFRTNDTASAENNSLDVLSGSQ